MDSPAVSSPLSPTNATQQPTTLKIRRASTRICLIFSLSIFQATEDRVSQEAEVKNPELRDLDDYLQNLRGYANSDKDRSHLDVMEKLVAFTKRQMPESGTSPHLSSESKCNIHQKAPPSKKHSLHVLYGATLDGSNATDKRTLPPKTRTMTRHGNKHPSTCTNLLGTGNEEEQVRGTTSASAGCHESHQHGEDKESAAVQPEFRRSSTVPPEPKHLNRNDAPAGGEQKERALTLELLKKHRPTNSVYREQPAAERTDVLYDTESSHLQSFNTLPQDVPGKGCILLIVYLSSPGVIRDRAHEMRKHRYPAETKSHIYNTLVTWFLSLVGPDSQHSEGKGVAKAPFWVAGLQQVWTEEGLALLALAVAPRSYSLTKRDFESCVCSFLSNTSLGQIARWLPELKVLLDQQAFTSATDLPSSSLNSFISATSNKKSLDKIVGLSPGFYWQTVATQECVCRRRETTQELHTEVSFALGGSDVFLDPLVTHYTLQLVLVAGLDVCGLRLLYPPHRFLGNSAGVCQSPEDTCQPVLALAVRGPQAFSLLKDVTESLSRKTHAGSARRQEPRLFYSPGLASQVHKGLCLWFSGRLPRGTVQNHRQHLERIGSSGDSVGGNMFSLSTSSPFLCATTKADVLLVVSPAVPPCCYGQVLAVCERRGFGLEGLQRQRLQGKRASLLGLTREQAQVFCSSLTESSDQELTASSRCLVLLLKKENAVHHSHGLPAALMRDFKAQKLLSCIHLRDDGVQAVEPNLCFHTVPYSSNLFRTVVSSMWTVPDPTEVILSHQKHQANCDTEQVVILTLCGRNMAYGLGLLHQMLTQSPEGDTGDMGFKLLDLKWLPGLTQLQAQELSPYEVGEQLFHRSVAALICSPTLLCAVKRRNAFALMRKLLPYDYPGNLTVLMSPTPEVALRQASLFFERRVIGC